MRIKWTEPAVSDLKNIKDYIAKDSKYYAHQFVDKIIESVENLNKFPERGRIVPEADDENIRELLFHNYRIIYRIDIKGILILTIIHGSRDLTRKKTQPWEIL